MREYKSDKQVKEHLKKFSAKEHHGAKHEMAESAGFEKAEHRLGKGKIGGKEFKGKH